MGKLVWGHAHQTIRQFDGWGVAALKKIVVVGQFLKLAIYRSGN